MPQRGPLRPFTKRQDEIAEGIRRGLSYKQIAAQLVNEETGRIGISPHTVAAQVKMMALLFDAFAADGELGQHLPPRTVILVYATYRHIERSQIAAD
jgi:hypothetical protein